MKMIIGGAHQGKLAYAKKQYCEIKWIDGEKCRFDEIFTCAGIYHFHTFIKRMLESDIEIKGLAADIIERNPDIIIISDEIGYGLVPVERFERNYREQVGRVCTKLAQFSERVDRVVCGIGNIIKM